MLTAWKKLTHYYVKLVTKTSKNEYLAPHRCCCQHHNLFYFEAFEKKKYAKMRAIVFNLQDLMNGHQIFSNWQSITIPMSESFGSALKPSTIPCFSSICRLRAFRERIECLHSVHWYRRTRELDGPIKWILRCSDISVELRNSRLHISHIIVCEIQTFFFNFRRNS